MKNSRQTKYWSSWLIVLLATAGWSAAYGAEADTSADTADDDVIMEEVVVVGRFRSAATDVVAEQIDSDVPMDFLDAESISRTGDSDVAAALRRMPGLTLAKGSFVYVRGLGERYSSTLLNGARVPSPDLTRNVLPLDVFPAAVVDSLAVSKGFSPELPAAFGGGNIDVRTKSVPDDTVFNLSLQSGWASEQNNRGLTYNGGDDDWKGQDDGTREQSQVLLDAIQFFQGDFNSNNIQQRLAGDGVSVSLDEAAQINRDLAKELNRDINLDDQKDLPPDYNASGTLGTKWYLGENWEFGTLAYGEYDRKWRNLNRRNELVSNPETDYSNTQRTVDAVNITGSLNAGLRFTDDHDINAMYLYIRDTEDDASLTLSCRQGQYNDCGDDDPNQGRIIRYRYEERKLLARQLNGEHVLGVDTLALLPDSLQWLDVLQGTQVDWFYSSSDVKTDLPSEIAINGVQSLDPNDLRVVISQAIQPTGSALDYRYSDLHDDVEDYGASLTVPWLWRSFDMEFSTGYAYYQKTRSYKQYSYGLGSTVLGFDDIRFDQPAQVFSDENLDTPIYGLDLLLGIGGFGTESYAAAEKVAANFYKVDILWDETWRLSGGARWEEFQQAVVPIDYTGFGSERLPLTTEELAASVTKEDDWYPSVFLTYIKPNFFADEFQARFGWSETVARPDIREISPAAYVDPLTEARVRGNPLLETSDLSNWDVRLGWYWDSGDNLSISGFYKDISKPIETVQGDATEDNILFGFVNAESAEVYGIELEGLKSLGFLSNWVGGWVDAFYLSGNLTLSDSEIKTPPGAGVGNITNEERRMTQQSDWVVNAQLGYDSFNGRHSATLVYNAFGERIFYAGINGFDDAKEQPFNSLDFVYSYFPSESITVRLRLKNLLDEDIHIKQGGVDVLKQDVNVEYLLDFTWSL